MIENTPASFSNPEQSRYDHEFISKTTRWFDSNREDQLAYSTADEEQENYAYYQDQLGKDLKDLGAPGALERRIKEDGTAEEYGDQEARAMAVAESMAVLGHSASLRREMERKINKGDLDDQRYRRTLRRSKEAEELFMQSSEKIFTPIKVDDTESETSAIVETYQNTLQEGSILGDTEQQLQFKALQKSTSNPYKLKKELNDTIESLGSRLGEQVYKMAQRPLDNYGDTRLEMAGINKLLYRCMKVKGHIA